MKWSIGIVAVLMVLAIFLVVGNSQMSAQELKGESKITGKVTAYTPNKTISVELPSGKVVNNLNITKFTKIEGNVEVGVTVVVQLGDSPKNARTIQVKK